MKKTALLLVVCALIGCGQADRNLTLRGHIEGLQEGDTLFLSTFILPTWDESIVDTIYADKPGEFIFKKQLEHTTFFLLAHAPKDAPRIESCIRGASFLAKPGDIIDLQGSVYTIGALNKTGGFYNDSLIARLDSLENISDKEMISIFSKGMEAQKSGQQDSILKYQQAYNVYERPKELKELRKYIIENVNDNEYIAFMYLTRLHDLRVPQLEKRFAEFTPKAKESYMGQHLYSMLKVLKNIEPGNTPSEFSVKDMNGNIVRLSDYRGKYLLIYNWGLCPGTMWVQPRILKLYEEFHNKGFEVLGFTMNDFFSINAELKTNPKIEPLFNQPWTTVMTDLPGNEFIVEDYYLAGVPILMLISPEGTTIARGYSEVYNQVKKTLEENL